ncbi:MAG TPA: DUF433 domain-containing protein [Acidimicrobiales bacterium]|nr:DUF433 domain-containing protein [Acidimicrobiales bacterium]
MSSRPEPARGRYLADEVGRLAGVPGTTIGQWARRGYIPSSHSEANPRVYCYQDVAEAMVVHELFVQGVGRRAVRATVIRLRQELDTPWPLQKADLLVPAGRAPGRPARSVVVDSGESQMDVVAGHPVLAGLDLVGVVSDLSRGGWAARTIPITHIEVDPGRLSGRPVIKGRRVSAELVAELAATTQGVDTLKHDYGLSGPEIEDARRWWHEARRLAGAERR